jgi:hypothetical protein
MVSGSGCMALGSGLMPDSGRDDTRVGLVVGGSVLQCHSVLSHGGHHLH